MTRTQLAILRLLAQGWTITIDAIADTNAMLIAPSEEMDNKPLATRTYLALTRAGCLTPLPQRLARRRRFGISEVGRAAIEENSDG